MKNNNKIDVLDLKTLLSGAMKGTITNGEVDENQIKQPLALTINNHFRNLIETGTEAEILTNLNSLNETLQDADLIKSNPSFVHDLKDSLKTIFEVPQIGIGLEQSDIENNPTQKVLSENKDLAKSLFSSMLKSNVRKVEGEKPVVDIDISSVLYMGHLQSVLGKDAPKEVSKLIKSDLINELLEDPEILKSIKPEINEGDNALEKNINDFRSLQSLVIMSKDIKNHISKNSAPKQEGDFDIIDEIEAFEGSYSSVNRELNESLTPEELEKQKEATKMLKDAMYDPKTDKSLFLFEGANTLDDKYKKTQEEAAAMAYAKNKDQINVENKKQEFESEKTLDQLRDEEFAASQLRLSHFTQRALKDEHKCTTRGLNPIYTELHKHNKHGYAEAKVAGFNRFTGVAIIEPAFSSNQSILKAVFAELRVKNPVKEGKEFNLYLNFRGTGSEGSAYISNSIIAAMSLTPPIPLNNIHVPKRFAHIKQEFLDMPEYSVSAQEQKEDGFEYNNDDDVNDLDLAAKEAVRQKASGDEEQPIGEEVDNNEQDLENVSPSNVTQTNGEEPAFSGMDDSSLSPSNDMPDNTGETKQENTEGTKQENASEPKDANKDELLRELKEAKETSSNSVSNKKTTQNMGLNKRKH